MRRTLARKSIELSSKVRFEARRKARVSRTDLKFHSISSLSALLEIVIRDVIRDDGTGRDNCVRERIGIIERNDVDSRCEIFPRTKKVTFGNV